MIDQAFKDALAGAAAIAARRKESIVGYSWDGSKLRATFAKLRKVGPADMIGAELEQPRIVVALGARRSGKTAARSALQGELL